MGSNMRGQRWGALIAAVLIFLAGNSRAQQQQDEPTRASRPALVDLESSVASKEDWRSEATATEVALSVPYPAVAVAPEPPADGEASSALPDAPESFPDFDSTPDSEAASNSEAAPIKHDDLRLLPPDNASITPPSNKSVTFDGLDLQAGYELVRERVLHQSSNQNQSPAIDPVTGEPIVHAERYHWGGLIGQSLFFNLVENTVRIESDDQIRALLAHKPFWHDWLVSTQQFNMRRWNDGDDFLVNYVGHPMQGAVSGFIEIQNDPVGRELEISATREYWMSRFRGFLWATVYSTHSEISPIGEAGIGNEGGWTYPINCEARYTAPGTCKKYTNNTGWVDFIVTPTVGSLWLITEDTLDRYVSDRLQGGNRSRLFPKIVRGALNPSRTMANALRFKLPWYRDSQHDPEVEKLYGIQFEPLEEPQELSHFHRFLLMPNFVAFPMGTAEHHCAGCLENPGIGVNADFLFMRWMSISFAAGTQTGMLEKAWRANGSISDWGLGVRLLHHGQRSTLSFAVRPGALTENVTAPAFTDPLHNTYPAQVTQSSTTHAAITLMLSNDYTINRFFAFRYSFGDTIVRYRSPIETPPGIGKPPYLSWLSHDNYTNRSEWTSQIGPVLSF